MPSTTSIADHDVSHKQQKTLLADFVKRCLSREERLLVTLYYCEELTLHEIAIVLDRPFDYVHQLHKRIIGRVKRQFSPAAGKQILVA